LIFCPHCGIELTPEETKRILSQALRDGTVSRLGGRPKGAKNKSPRPDIGKEHRKPEFRKKEAESELKKLTSAQNGRKGGRPKGSKNKAPRSDIGKKRVKHDENV